MNMKFIVALCGGASLLAIAPAAFAQQAAPTSTAPSTLETVVVTGSRIVRNGYAAPTPVTVATADQLQALTPTDIPDGLNKLPVFDGSQVGGAGSNGSGVAGNYLNLRDFGINRTLILMNGLRVPPTNYNGQIDANTIPQMLLQRVDVVTGGASAVYGSDAVTGVVNFVMDTHFNGLKLQADTGISNSGDIRLHPLRDRGRGRRCEPRSLRRQLRALPGRRPDSRPTSLRHGRHGLGLRRVGAGE
jgi:iron complex outermembrane receptor protein